MSDDIKKTVDPVEAAPFESMTKTQMREHLRTDHGGLYMDSKATIADMTRWHEQVHRYTDPVVAQAENRPLHRMSVPHVHSALTLTDEEKARLASVRSGSPLAGGPISTAEVRALTALVDNDFAGLRMEIKSQAGKALSAALVEYEEQFGERREQAQVYTTKVYDLLLRHQDEAKRLEAEAEQNGIHLRVPVQTYTPKAEVKGYEEGRRAVQAENKEALDRAMIALEAKRLTTQRRVMLLAISAQAAEILDTIPSAQALMAGAQGEPAQIG